MHIVKSGLELTRSNFLYACLSLANKMESIWTNTEFRPYCLRQLLFITCDTNHLDAVNDVNTQYECWSEGRQCMGQYIV